jgi:fructose-1-phosphate kinase PfkB-like protein
MIYTCTLNPAIDLFVELEEFHPFVVNRTTSEYYQANGKGINISFILKRMGINSIAMRLKGSHELRRKEDFVSSRPQFQAINRLFTISTLFHQAE